MDRDLMELEGGHVASSPAYILFFTFCSVCLTCTGTLASTRSSTFASVSLFRKYSFVNSLHSSLDVFDLCAYLQVQSIQSDYASVSALHQSLLVPIAAWLPEVHVVPQCEATRLETHPYPGRSTRYQLSLIRKWFIQIVFPAHKACPIFNIAQELHSFYHRLNRAKTSNLSFVTSL